MTGNHQIKHVLVGTDFSENANLALRWAIKVLGTGKAKISLVHSIGSHPVNSKTPLETALTEVKQHLAVAGEPARKAGHAVDYHYGPEKPWNLIVQTADELHVDLVVLGTH